MSGNKRKRNTRPGARVRSSSPPAAEIPLHARPLRIQAYEADLVHERPNLAGLVEMREVNGGRGGLMCWADQDVWVDRFDARLLLASVDDIASSGIPSSSTTRYSPPPNVGWDDLPSDSEDTFFLTPREVADYHRDKRLRMMEKGRQDRLRALAEEDGDAGEIEPPEAQWGGSDEEPDEAQANLMSRTATHIRDSPNPAQLEMRILANHGSDPRFAFLRGRWRRAWTRMRQAPGAPKIEPKGSTMGGLAGYASESEDSESDGGRRGEPTLPPTDDTIVSVPEGSDEMERLKAERRARAKEWARQRKENRDLLPG
ncbi:hypothetical protein BDV93DRAFT_559835 [Ceratobasidium sp. AG-I]|nr:hypothetical protein BDV93DRAFT_559835 [Ceratobasidium sp. AG-I]